jgi:hypothetical protein
MTGTAICYLTCNKKTDKMEEIYKKLPNKNYTNYVVSDFKEKLTFNKDINHFEFDYSKYIKEPINACWATYVSIFSLQKLNDFDYVWLIEDDVAFNGNFATFFDFYKEKNYDFICPTYGLNDNNSHWWRIQNNLLRGDYKTKIPTAGGFGQIVRYSKRMIKIMSQLVERDIYSTNETFPHTVCNLEKLTFRAIIDDNFLKKDFFDYNLRFTENDLAQIPKNLLIHAIKF